MNEANTLEEITGAPETVEQEIQRKGLTAPRIKPADIEENIRAEYYFTGAQAVTQGRAFLVGEYPGYESLELLTFCVLVLRNGFTVHGVSACASPENCNEELGRKIARENAKREIWPLTGYELRSVLSGQRLGTLTPDER